jgi:hypothetical protein
MSRSIPLANLAAVLGAALLLGACGGGAEGDAAEVPVAAALSARAASDHGPGDRGGPAAGGPIAHAEAERMERALRGGVVWVDADCCKDDIDLVSMLAYGMQAAKNLDNDAPFFVTGSDPQLVARLVARLAQSGITRAYRVVP